jgi:hypothetical protein
MKRDRSGHTRATTGAGRRRNQRKARISRTIAFVIQRVTELAIALATMR